MIPKFRPIREKISRLRVRLLVNQFMATYDHHYKALVFDDKSFYGRQKPILHSFSHRMISLNFWVELRCGKSIITFLYHKIDQLKLNITSISYRHCVAAMLPLFHVLFILAAQGIVPQPKQSKHGRKEHGSK